MFVSVCECPESFPCKVTTRCAYNYMIYIYIHYASNHPIPGVRPCSIHLMTIRKNNQNNQGCLGFMVQWHPMIMSFHQWSPRALFTFLQVHTSSTFQFLRTCLRILKYLVYTNWLFFIFQMCSINTLPYHVLSVSHSCLLKRWIFRMFNAVSETSSIFWLKNTMIISQKMTVFFWSHQQITFDNWMNYKNSTFSTMFFGSRQVNRHITPHDCWVALNGKARPTSAFPWLLVRIPEKHNGKNKEQTKKRDFLHHDSWCQDVFC